MTAQCAPTSFGVGQLSIACDCQIAIFCSLRSPAAMEWSLGDLYLQALALHPPSEARDSRALRILHTAFIPPFVPFQLLRKSPSGSVQRAQCPQRRKHGVVSFPRWWRPRSV